MIIAVVPRFYMNVMHIIPPTRPARFSVCNIKKLVKGPGNDVAAIIELVDSISRDGPDMYIPYLLE